MSTDQLNGAVTLEWNCSRCGNIRRTECTDITGAVYAFRPAGWLFDGTRPVCSSCAPEVAPKVTNIVPPSNVMRDRLDHGLRAGGAGEPDPADKFGMGKPMPAAQAPAFAGGGGVPHDILRDSEGKPVTVMGPGGAGGHGQEGTYRTAGAGGGGGQWDAGTIPAPENSAVGRKEARFGNVVFEDTRKSEFVGPEKVMAGVPTLGSNTCVGCRREINDGTVNGVAEAWRWAQNPENGVDRGHPECLAKIGR